MTGIDGGHVTFSGLLLPTSVIEPAWSTMHLKLLNLFCGKKYILEFNLAVMCSICTDDEFACQV